MRSCKCCVSYGFSCFFVKTCLCRAFENCCVALYGLFVCAWFAAFVCVFNVFVWFVCDLVCEAVWFVFVWFVYVVCVSMCFVWFVYGVLGDGARNGFVCVLAFMSYVMCSCFVCDVLCDVV